MELCSEKESDSVSFREVQVPDRKLIILIGMIAAVPAVILWYFLFGYFIMMPFLALGISFLISFFRKLVTEVREDGIYVRVYSIGSSFRSFPFKNIQSYEVRTIDEIIYHMRGTVKDIPRPYTSIYAIKSIYAGSSRGVLIEFTEEKNISKIMIGSQVPEKLAGAIKRGIERQTSL
jgi:hypothetical protein